jgi:hypothetical protein
MTLHYKIVFSSEQSLKDYITLLLNELKLASANNKIKLQTELNNIYKIYTQDHDYKRLKSYKQGFIK